MLQHLNGLLRRPRASTPLLVVMGNEGADLDSIVSALVYACHLSLSPAVLHRTAPGTLPVPLVNVHREDLQLRRDTLMLFQNVGVDIQALCCSDEVDLDLLHQQEQLKICLVDHNRLCSSQSRFRELVVDIIDHHVDEKLFEDVENPPNMIIEPVGSAISLVIRKILQEDGKELIDDPSIARLCLACILLDTANLDSSKKNFSQLDIQLCEQLIKCSGCKSQDEFYNELLLARCDVSGFTTDQLLRKDAKTLVSGDEKNPETHIISGVSMSYDDWRTTDPELMSSLGQFAENRGMTLVIAMLMFTDTDTGEFTRQLLIYTQDADLGERIADSLVNEAELDLQLLEDISKNRPFCRLYRQHNVRLSRKKVLPLVKCSL